MGRLYIWPTLRAGGRHSTVAQLPLPPNSGNPGNWSAKGFSDTHLAAGGGYGGMGLPRGGVGPTAPGANSWLEPVMLPLPDFPRGINSAEAVGVELSGLVVGTVQHAPEAGDQIPRLALARGAGERCVDRDLPWGAAVGLRVRGSGGIRYHDAGVIVGWVGTSATEYTALWYPDAAVNYTQPPTVGPGPAWNTFTSTAVAGR